MMYKYRIQWVFNKQDAKKIIKVIGAKSLNVIVFRDSNFKIISQYDGMSLFNSSKATLEACKYINEEYRKDKNIIYVELLRK